MLAVENIQGAFNSDSINFFSGKINKLQKYGAIFLWILMSHSLMFKRCKINFFRISCIKFNWNFTGQSDEVREQASKNRYLKLESQDEIKYFR